MTTSNVVTQHFFSDTAAVVSSCNTVYKIMHYPAMYVPESLVVQCRRLLRSLVKTVTDNIYEAPKYISGDADLFRLVCTELAGTVCLQTSAVHWLLVNNNNTKGRGLDFQFVD